MVCVRRGMTYLGSHGKGERALVQQSHDLVKNVFFTSKHHLHKKLSAHHSLEEVLTNRSKQQCNRLKRDSFIDSAEQNNQGSGQEESNCWWLEHMHRWHRQHVASSQDVPNLVLEGLHMCTQALVFLLQKLEVSCVQSN